ncbi:hypothetical protein DFH11DRAFT_884477 [Phellopilus nigrolimitatus]|nr:hypothetical protein DFH11DRAFT_884477 [Phellopilus nigrolimitatus]
MRIWAGILNDSEADELTCGDALSPYPPLCFLRIPTTLYSTSYHRCQSQAIRSAKTGLGSTLGTDWSMTTFDGRSDDQSFDSSRLQTIDETSEVAYFHPFKPLEYLDYDALEYVQNAWIHDTPHESFARKLVTKIRSALADISKKARKIWHLLSSI